MKNQKSFFEVSEKLLVCGVKRCIAGCYKFFSFKNPIVFAAIFVPCLLQFPLVACGQDGTDSVDGFFMPVKCTGESVHSKSVITDGGNFWGESQFVNDNCASQFSSYISPFGETMHGDIAEQDNYKTEKSECCFGFQDDDYFILYIFSFLLVGFAIAHAGLMGGQLYYYLAHDFVAHFPACIPGLQENVASPTIILRRQLDKDKYLSLSCAQ